MGDLFLYIYFLSFLLSAEGITLNIILYFKNKQNLFKESLVYNFGLFFLVLSIFLNEYVTNFLFINNMSWLLKTFEDICIITYVLIIFRIFLLINKRLMKGKYLKISVFLFFYYIILWQITHNFHGRFNIYHKFLLFITLTSEYVLITIFPLISCAIIVEKIYTVENIVYRKLITSETVISILIFTLIPIYKFFIMSNNDLHFTIVHIFAGYLIVHMVILIYFEIKFFFVEDAETSKDIINEIEIIDYQFEIDVFQLYKISPREKEIIEEMKLGLSNTEIAEKLFITENTVKKHISNVYVKVEVNNRYKLLGIFK